MATTPICTIGPQGISRPTLADCLAYFANGYLAIYGNDVQIASADQDGELLGLLAAALDAVNAQTVSAYNAYSPATAQGAGLSSNVKINGIARNVPTYSSVPVLVVGQAYLSVGVIQTSDGSGNVWAVPALTIPSSGQIASTATCQSLGAISLGSGVALTIMNPTRGLQSVTTTAVAAQGSPVENDAQLRIRQSLSTELPSSTRMGSIVSALAQIPNIGRISPYQNSTGLPDANGVPGFSIAIVVDGGDAATIAAAISNQKFACGTYGTTTETVVDSVGVTHPINFFYTSKVPIMWAVTLTPGPQFSTNTIALIQTSLATWTNGLAIGEGIQLSRAWAAVYLTPSINEAAANLAAASAAGDAAGIATYAAQLTTLNAAAKTYEVTVLAVSRDGASPAAGDVTISFNEAAYLSVDPTTGAPTSPSSVTVTL